VIRGFTFERALSWPFNAPHIATFPWLFGLAYAALFLAVFGVIGFLAAGDMTAWISTVERIEGSTDPDEEFAAIMASFARLLPWAAVSGLVSWIIWAMFETASQRRYIRGEGFSLGFGADELRMMVVGLFYGLIGFVVVAIPMFLVVGSTFWSIFANINNPDVLNSPEFSNRAAMQMLGAFGVTLVMLPVYVFLATRLAPCFGLTLKEKRIRFFDAWNVSRGRFWPILGAYVILAVVGSLIGQVISGVAQLVLMPAMASFSNAAERGEDIRSLIFSAGFMVPMGFYMFVALFLQGLLQHVVGGPAALAVRHDPRGGVEEAEQVGAFD
jgi:hypothetical protein